MVREIKFRAWDNEKKKMLIGNNGLCMFLTCGVLGWNFAYEINILSSYIRQDRYILMQFTGLKDSKGVDIYESDIVKSYHFSPSEVKYNNGSFMFEDITPADAECCYEDIKWEVIGNKYEHPELLQS